MEPKIIERLESIEDPPTLPLVINKLHLAIEDPKSDAKSIAQIIEDDPAIMARILKMVNSAMYFPIAGQEITSVQSAISRLGFRAIKNIALSMSVFNVFPKSVQPSFNRKDFWKHSICVGITASVLYDFCANAIDTRLSKDVLHLAGLLHDLGKILLENYFPDGFHLAIQRANKENLSLFEAEWASYQTAHDEIGLWIADKWNLPPDIAAAIRFHHDNLEAPEEHRTLVNIIHLADYICITQGLGDSGNPKPNYHTETRESLGLDLANIAPLMEQVEEETKKSELLLSIINE